MSACKRTKTRRGDNAEVFVNRKSLVLIALLCLGCGASKTEVLIPATAAEVMEAVKNADANAVLVNVWATWCAPCVEEFPDIMAVYQQYKSQGLKVIFVSADFEDQADEARAFLKSQGVDFPTYLKLSDDRAFINTLDPYWSGAMPATWIYDSEVEKRHFWIGKASREFLQKKVRDVLSQ